MAKPTPRKKKQLEQMNLAICYDHKRLLIAANNLLLLLLNETIKSTFKPKIPQSAAKMIGK